MRERIRINGDPISEDLFAKYTEDVWNRLEATKDQAVLDLNDPKKVCQATRYCGHGFITGLTKVKYRQSRVS